METKYPRGPASGTVNGARCSGGGKLSGSRVQPAHQTIASSARVRDRVTNPDCNAPKKTKAAGITPGRLRFFRRVTIGIRDSIPHPGAARDSLVRGLHAAAGEFSAARTARSVDS